MLAPMNYGNNSPGIRNDSFRQAGEYAGTAGIR